MLPKEVTYAFRIIFIGEIIGYNTTITCKEGSYL